MLLALRGLFFLVDMSLPVVHSAVTSPFVAFFLSGPLSLSVVVFFASITVGLVTVHLLRHVAVPTQNPLLWLCRYRPDLFLLLIVVSVETHSCDMWQYQPGFRFRSILLSLFAVVSCGDSLLLFILPVVPDFRFSLYVRFGIPRTPTISYGGAPSDFIPVPMALLQSSSVSSYHTDGFVSTVGSSCCSCWMATIVGLQH
jgi:hypothetical protein